MDEVRCLCGNLLKADKHEAATYHSGGRYEYRCRRCGATAVLWSRHGVDDEIIGGALFSPDGREHDLVWNDEVEEWRIKGRGGAVMRVRVVERTCDGATRTIATFPSRGQAIAYLRRAAEECRATGHRRVELDEDAFVLVTEYGGDDTVVTFVEEEEEVVA